MIRVRCRTNLDDYKNENWPEEMAARPMLGDKVQSISGRFLTVVDITHAMRSANLREPELKRESYLIVELHKRI